MLKYLSAAVHSRPEWDRKQQSPGSHFWMEQGKEILKSKAGAEVRANYQERLTSRRYQTCGKGHLGGKWAGVGSERISRAQDRLN